MTPRQSENCNIRHSFQPNLFDCLTSAIRCSHCVICVCGCVWNVWLDPASKRVHSAKVLHCVSLHGRLLGIAWLRSFEQKCLVLSTSTAMICICICIWRHMASHPSGLIWRKSSLNHLHLSCEKWLFTIVHQLPPLVTNLDLDGTIQMSRQVLLGHCLGSLGALRTMSCEKILPNLSFYNWKLHDNSMIHSPWLTYRFHQIFLQYRETCVPLQDLPACLGWRCASWSASISCSILTYLDDSAHPSCSIMRFWSFLHFLLPAGLSTFFMWTDAKAGSPLVKCPSGKRNTP